MKVTNNSELGIRFILNDVELVQTLLDEIKDCDVDELAHLAGDAFGGFCQYSSVLDKFLFYPNKNYGGAFDHLKK